MTSASDSIAARVSRMVDWYTWKDGRAWDDALTQALCNVLGRTSNTGEPSDIPAANEGEAIADYVARVVSR